MGYIAEHTSIVRVADVSGKPISAMMADGTILIPSSSEVPISTISVRLINPQGYTGLTLGISSLTASTGTYTAQQTNVGEIEVKISGAANGDEYLLTLTMQSPDGLRNFTTYTLAVRCVYFSGSALQNAINAIPAGGGGTITLPNGTDISLTGAITISGNRTITITGPASGTATLERAETYFTGPLIDVTSGSSLTLKSSGGGLVLDGGWDNVTGTGINSESAAITVSGNLTLENGATVKRNKNRNPATGGGVYVASTGSFTMNGGSIEYNEGGDGGGVIVYGGNFEMNGGSITYNKAMPGNSNPDGGGVLVIAGGARFIMNNGEIAHNYAQRYGGGVHVYSEGGAAANFTMHGGIIHHNEAQRGGGIDMWQNGGPVTFTMNGGTITANHATGNGGGVYNNNNTGAVNGSASPLYSGISGNTAGGSYPDKNF
jgi:hypothetical protein